MNYSRFKDIASYIGNITELIWDYITNRHQYPDNAKLAVQPEVSEVVIDNPSNCHGCDFYEVKNFISIDPTGHFHPNEAAIQLLAGKYYQTA